MATLKFKNANQQWEIAETPGAVKYIEQTLTEEQKAQARANIGVTENGSSEISVTVPRAATLIIGNKAKGHTKADCDVLCEGTQAASAADTTLIQNAINKTNGGRILILKGSYYLNKSLDLPSRATLEGEGATDPYGGTSLYGGYFHAIRVTTNDSYHNDYYKNAYAHIKNLSIVNGTSGYAGIKGTAKTFLIENVTIDGYGVGIWSTHGSIVIRNCNITSPLCGIGLKETGDNVIVDGNNINITTDYSSGIVYGIRLYDYSDINTLPHNVSTTWVNAIAGDSKIINNTIKATTFNYSGRGIASSRRCQISNNFIISFPYGIQLYRADQSIVTNNRIKDHLSYFVRVIELTGCNDCVVTSNLAKKITSLGTNCYTFHGNSVSNCIISNNRLPGGSGTQGVCFTGTVNYNIITANSWHMVTPPNNFETNNVVANNRDALS